VSTKNFANTVNFVPRPQKRYSPYLRSYENNDEIRIAIQNQDLYVLLSESFLHIQGHITKHDDSLVTTIALLNNCMAYLFNEIRYELNGIEIDRTRHLGVASDLKNYISIKRNQPFLLPLILLLGFAEDYNKILLNGKHELTLSAQLKMTISSIVWKMPHVKFSDAYKLYKFLSCRPYPVANTGSKKTAEFTLWVPSPHRLIPSADPALQRQRREHALSE